ncbi:MAG: HD domain-containing protein [Candidatus Hermodarchaeota archaeon]
MNNTLHSLEDKVYGKISLSSPVIPALIQSKPLQRLKNINQAGASQFILDKPQTRYEHSVGVMLLLRRLGAPLEEQIAGLLHDVSHTAFCHTIDFVFHSDEHNYHELWYEKIIEQSEIPQILDRYNISLNGILDVKNFPLLEQPLPNLCADRLDYSFRDLVTYRQKNQVVAEYMKNLRVIENKIYFQTLEQGLSYAKDFIELDRTIYADPREIAAFYVLAQAIKEALRSNIITKAQLFLNDKQLFSILQNSKNETIKAYLRLLNLDFAITLDPDDYDFLVKTKVRYVNPPILEYEGQRVSELDQDFEMLIINHKKRIDEGFPIRILKGI